MSDRLQSDGDTVVWDILLYRELKDENGRAVGSCKATWWGGGIGANPNFEPIFFYTNVI